MKHEAWKDKAGILLEKLNFKLTSYEKVLIYDFDKSFSTVVDYINNEEDKEIDTEIAKTIETMETLLEKLQKLPKFNYDDSDDEEDDESFSYFEKKLGNLVKKLNKKLRNHHNKSVQFTYIELAKNLIILDNFFQSNEPIKFQSIFMNFQTEYYKEIPDIEKKALLDIDSWDYKQLKKKLKELEEIKGDPKIKETITELSQQLTKSLKKLYQSTYSLLPSNISLDSKEFARFQEKIKVIQKNLNKGILKANIVNEYINKENFIQEASNSIYKKFENLIFDYLKEIKLANLENKDFQNFEQNLKIIRSFIQTFKKFPYETVNKAIDDLENSKQLCLQEIIELSENVRFEEYKINLLKNDFDNLKMLGDKKYQKIVETLRENLENKLKQQINFIKEKNQDIDLIQIDLQKLKKICSEKFNDEPTLITISDEALTEAEEEKTKKIKKLDSILNEDKYAELIEFISQNNFPSFVTIVSQNFNQRFDELHTKFLCLLEKENDSKCLDECMQIDELFQNFTNICKFDIEIKRKKLILEFDHFFEININNVKTFFCLNNENSFSQNFLSLMIKSLKFLIGCYQIAQSKSKATLEFFKNIEEDINHLLDEIFENHDDIIRRLKINIDNDLENLDEIRKDLAFLKKRDEGLNCFIQKHYSLYLSHFHKNMQGVSYIIMVQTAKTKFEYMQKQCPKFSSDKKNEYLVMENKFADIQKFLKDFFHDLEKESKISRKNSGLSMSSRLF